jgi:hypothetical protein
MGGVTLANRSTILPSLEGKVMRISLIEKALLVSPVWPSLEAYVKLINDREFVSKAPSR